MAQDRNLYLYQSDTGTSSQAHRGAKTVLKLETTRQSISAPPDIQIIEDFPDRD